MDPKQLSKIKALREATNISVDKCRIALEHVDYDLDEAIKYIRLHISNSISKEGRQTDEGLIAIAKVGNTVSLIEIKSETDFASRQQKFIDAANLIANIAAEKHITSLDNLLNIQEIELAKKELVLVLGENIQITKIITVFSDIAGAYVHDKKIGCIVTLKKGNEHIAQELAIHIVGFNPMAISYDDLSPDFIQQEIDIVRQQNATKPENILNQIIQGKVSKLASQYALLSQPFFRNSEQTVEEYLQENDAVINSFIRVVLGQ